MGPKVESVLRFVRRGGKEAIITSCDRLHEAVAGSAGTHIFRNREEMRLASRVQLEVPIGAR
jgi:hypothetical protein